MTRPTYAEQYAELEQAYREDRAFLDRLQRDQKRSEPERKLKAQRLLVLRAARDTLYDLARQEGGPHPLMKPADFGGEPS